MIKRRTAPSRFTRALRRIAEWCRRNRHRPIKEQHRDLVRKLQGHYAYYGITGNAVALGRFRYEALCRWRIWLHRRSQRARMTWATFNKLLERYKVPEVGCRAVRQQRLRRSHASRRAARENHPGDARGGVCGGNHYALGAVSPRRDERPEA